MAKIRQSDDKMSEKGVTINQPHTFAEDVVNDWVMTDDEDPSIIYSYAASPQYVDPRVDVDLPLEKRQKLDHPLGLPRQDQPGYTSAMSAFGAMQLRSDVREKAEHEWRAFTMWQHQMLGTQTLDSSGVISLKGLSGKIWTIRNFRLTDDPVTAVQAIFRNAGGDFSDYESVLLGLRMKRAEEFSDPRSRIVIHRHYFVDLVLRNVSTRSRRKGERLIQPKTSHCALPFCKYFKEKMPPGAYRLEFLDPSREEKSTQRYWLNEAEEEIGPGCGKKGNAWFCLSCIERLFNEVCMIAGIRGDGSLAVSQAFDFPTLWSPPDGSIEAEWSRRMTYKAPNSPDDDALQSEDGEAASESEDRLRAPISGVVSSAKPNITIPVEASSGPRIFSIQRPRPPQPPVYGPLVTAPGLSPFATQLSSLIHPELRYTRSEFYTLNSFECHALHLWKETCVRKQMFEIPQNRAFCAQMGNDYAMRISRPDLRVSDDRGSACVLEDWSPLSVHQGIHVPVKPLGLADIGTVRRLPSGQYTREVRPLTYIMQTMNQRVDDAMQKHGLSYEFVGAQSRPIADRTWPPRRYWEEAFQEERARRREEGSDAVDMNGPERSGDISSSDDPLSSTSEEEF
ncbi:MAG: hypothetical protein M1818_000408 [Claussenomyces sp. TS43310]|nr:MAG: hypothetical protein M1818_000408 [Claussenomyces sp. TS43310]